MNAYELADKLQMDKAKALLYVDTVVQSAEMLRQQADRIAELEKQTKPLRLDRQQQKISSKEIAKIYKKIYAENHKNQVLALARAIEERHGIK